MIPTKRLWALLAVGIVIAAIGALAGAPLLGLAYDVILFIAAYVTLRLAPSGKDLRLKRSFDPVLSVRVPNKIALTLTNDGAEQVQARIRDEAPERSTAEGNEFGMTLPPGDEKTVAYTVTPKERGDDAFQGTFVRIACPLGLVEKEIRLETEEPVRVYPNVLALREFDLLKQQGRLRELGIRRSRTRGLGTEFESLREYTEGDDFRKVDWKASARRNKLVVRQYEQERNQVVLVAVDIGRHMLAEVNGVRKLDHVLDSLLMLVNAAAVAGDQIGLLVYADTVRRYISPAKGRSQVGMIIEAIHDLVAEPVESDGAAAFSYLGSRWKRRSLMVAFTDVLDADRAKEVASSLGPLSRRHLVLLARVDDPRMREVLEAPIEDVEDMYKKTAARMLRADAIAAQGLLKSAGIHTLEAEPQDLAAALVSYYFTVKEQALL
ncbi:MAG: hypothetical protein QOJ65_1908 [Fimbriimonadaceae bacterium]|nr:hypothetical protein [Fimbriimonadaceae bacterium]